MAEQSNRSESCRVVVTGLGMVTPLGVGRTAFSDALFSGACGIDVIDAFETVGLSSHLGASVRGFSARDFISLKNLRRMDRMSLLAASATRLALDDAGVAITHDNRDRVGIILGTAFGSTDVTAQFADTLLGQGPQSVNPILVPNTVMNAPAGHTSIELGFRGVNTTVTHFAVSAETAICAAVSEIRRGAADCILTGGVDILSKFYYESLAHFRGLSPDDGLSETARPFDTGRNGYVPGEGAGILCLESLASARQRGAKIYAELTGLAMGSIDAPPAAWPLDVQGASRMLNKALDNAGLSAGDLDAVMAVANGSRVLDDTEAQAYLSVFSPSGFQPRITSIKGAIGESFSGGGIRACALALCMDKKRLPSTVGLETPCAPLSFVTGGSQAYDMNHAALAGISFGGACVYVIFSAVES